jgi:antitoxin ParD1/3/4
LHEALCLIEKREQKLSALREMADASIQRGGQNTDEDIELALNATAAELAKESY